MSEVSDLIMQIRNSNMPQKDKSDLEKRLLKEGPSGYIDLCLERGYVHEKEEWTLPKVDASSVFDSALSFAAGLGDLLVGLVGLTGACLMVLLAAWGLGFTTFERGLKPFYYGFMFMIGGGGLGVILKGFGKGIWEARKEMKKKQETENDRLPHRRHRADLSPPLV